MNVRVAYVLVRDSESNFGIKGFTPFPLHTTQLILLRQVNKMSQFLLTQDASQINRRRRMNKV